MKQAGAYYNEFDPFAAAWLRELIKDGLIAPGEVDERDIRDVPPTELRGFTQCHFFAGIGGWSYALRLAGWPDERPVWTGSCPCQPFSAAGKGAGFADERHLWPAFHWLISECRPPVLFGEQVASKDGLQWLDLVQADLEGTGYACGVVDTCAAGVGAPHLRQRLWFVADASGAERGESVGMADPAVCDGRRGECGAQAGVGPHELRRRGSSGSYAPRVVGDSHDARLEERSGQRSNDGTQQQAPERAGVSVCGLANPECRRCGPGRESGVGRPLGCGRDGSDLPATTPDTNPNGTPGPTNGFWGPVDWLFCRDGKWRPVEPGTFPLAHGVSNRVGLLRGAGNAIVPEVAAAFVSAYLDLD